VNEQKSFFAFIDNVHETKNWLATKLEYYCEVYSIRLPIAWRAGRGELAWQARHPSYEGVRGGVGRLPANPQLPR